MLEDPTKPPLTRRIVTLFIGFVFVLVLAYITLLSFAVYQVATLAGEQDWSTGLKPVLEKLWCGAPGCFDREQP